MSAELNGNLTPEEQLTGALDTSAQLVGSLNIGSGGGGGTNNYNDLTNKPQINNVTLSGNKTTADLGLFSGYVEDLHYTDLVESGTVPYMIYGSQSGHWGINTGAQLYRLSDVAFYSPASVSNGDILAISGAGTLNYKWTKTHLGAAAYTNDYSDLDNKPTIPAAQVNSDWNSSSGVSEILNKPSIPDELSELTDTNISSPTDGEYLKYDGSSSKWVNASGGGGGASSLAELTDTSISTPAGGQVLKYDGTAQKWVNVYLSYNNLVDKPTLATVATSGSYTDLTDKPTIPDGLDHYSGTEHQVGIWVDGTTPVYEKTVVLNSTVSCSAGNTSAAGAWTSVYSWNDSITIIDFKAYTNSGNDPSYWGHLSVQWNHTNKDIRVLNIRSSTANIDGFTMRYIYNT